MTEGSKNPRVVISSTARDLPEHREQVMHACMRLGMFYPDMMEHLTAEDASALDVSLRMVDKADIYVASSDSVTATPRRAKRLPSPRQSTSGPSVAASRA